MRRLVWLCAAVPLAAHTVSLSTGELDVRGATARYTLRLPAYELDHVREPERTILDAIRLEGAALAARRCVRNEREYVCEGRYVWADAPASPRVTIALGGVVVDHHVHVLHATRGEEIAQAVLTAAEPSAALRFQTAGWGMSVLRARPAAGAAAVLLVLTLGTLSTSVPLGMALLLAFAAGVLGANLSPWKLTPAFAETAIAIACAYAAFEAIFAERARARWAGALCLGLAAGGYIQALAPAPLRAAGILAIVCAAAFLLLLLCGRIEARLVRGARWLALAAALLWCLAMLV